MVGRHLVLGLWIAGLAVAWSPEAVAHGIGGGRLHIELDADTLYVMATPSVALFKAFDRNKDGRITKAEVKGKRDAMIALFLGHLQLRDHAGKAGKLVFSDLNPLHVHGKRRRGKHVRIHVRLRFSTRPVSIWLAYNAGKRAPLAMIAARSGKGRKVTTGKLERDDIVLTLLQHDRPATAPAKRKTK